MMVLAAIASVLAVAASVLTRAALVAIAVACSVAVMVGSFASIISCWMVRFSAGSMFIACNRKKGILASLLVFCGRFWLLEVGHS